MRFRNLLLVASLLVAVPVQSDPAIGAPLARRSLLLDAAVLDDRIIAVGERGHVLHFDRKGNFLSQAQVPTQTMLTAVTFIDQTRGWAVGHDSTILRTQDGGRSWEKIAGGGEHQVFFDILFVNREHALIIGAYGTALASNDGGTSWAPYDLFGRLTNQTKGLYPDIHLYQFGRDRRGVLYIAAEAGNLLRSIDQGNSWQALPLPYQGSLFGVLPLGGQSVMCFGMRGNVFHSDDGGLNWVRIVTGTRANLHTGTRLSDGAVLVAGMQGTLLVLRGARQHALRQSRSRKTITALAMAADGDLLLFGDGGVRKLAAQQL